MTANSLTGSERPPPVALRDIPRVYAFLVHLLGPERQFVLLGLLYGLGIGILSLATPVSVQMLINNVANTGLTTPLLVLSLTLFGLLLLAGTLSAMRIHIMDLFGRKFYARMMSEITLRALYARNPYFDDRQQGPLFNRYFDIINVLKALPNLVVGGFTIILQMLVGFVLVSMYHPAFFVFNVILLLLVWLIWALWGTRAIRSAVALSHQKHAGAAWVESIAGANSFFKTEAQISQAVGQAEALTASYVDHHQTHFRDHFAQTLSFLFIYALASAVLLGLGGWLVINGQLSLGQLVAAELVLSAVFVGLSQLGIYLAYFYDLCGAIDELSLFYDIEQRELVGDEWLPERPADLGFVGVKGTTQDHQVHLDFKLTPGARIYAHAVDARLQRFATNMLKRQRTPTSGYIVLGGAEIGSLASAALSQSIMVLDRPGVVELSIRDYLRYSSLNAEPDNLLSVLDITGLTPTLTQLPDGLDTKLAATGWPLATAEVMQLKLAGALLGAPAILILNQLYDLVNPAVLQRSLDHLRDHCRTTVLYFSNRTGVTGYDNYLFLDYERQQSYSTYDQMAAAEGTQALGEPILGTASAPATTSDNSA